MASAARSVAAHRPQVLVADGQGAHIALGMSRPLVLEAVLSLRNVDIKEALQIAKAWGNVKAIIIKNPRVSKARLRLTELKQAIPELFDKDHPWKVLRVPLCTRETESRIISRNRKDCARNLNFFVFRRSRARSSEVF